MFHRPTLAPTFAVACFVCLVVFFLTTAGPATARSPEDVACNRSALSELLSRLSVTDAAGQPPTVPQTLFLSRRGEGSFEGLVVGASGWRALSPAAGTPAAPGPEHHLAFQLHPGSRDLLANPERPPLPQVTLVREAQGTSPVAPGSPFEIHLHLDPTLAPDDAPPGVRRPLPAAALRIDSLAVAADPPDAMEDDPVPGRRLGTLADTGPGRGVPADLGAGCGAPPGPRERRLLAVLQRTLRPRLVDEIAGTVYDARVALFRGLVDGEARAAIRLVDPVTGNLLAGELELAVSAEPGSDGRLLGSGGIRLLRRTGVHAGVRGTIELVQPGVPGLEGTGETVAALTVDPVVLAASELFDWHEVLEPTAWNSQPSLVAVVDSCTELAAAGGVTTAAIARAKASVRDTDDGETGDGGSALLAARLAWALVGEASLVDRLRADRRQMGDALARSGFGREVPPFSPGTPGDRLVVRGRLRELATGRSPRWETLLGCLGARPRYEPERGRAVVEIAPVFDLALLAEQLETAAAVTEVTPVNLRPSTPPDALCARSGTGGGGAGGGEVIEYRLSFDADEYVHLVSRPVGEARDVYEVRVENLWSRKLPTPAPDWMEGGWICDAWGG